MSTLTQITVPFHNAELFLVEHNGQPYTPMKPIVEGMGLAWQSQLAKLNANPKRWGITKIVIPTLGDLQEMVCLPLRKLLGWMTSISPNKVKPELKDTVILYQNECDDVLWDYWTKGQAINPRTTKQDRVPLKDAVNMLVGKAKFLNYSDAYKLVHHRFDVKHIEEIPQDKIPEAVEYIHRLMGEYIAKVETIEDSDLKSLKLLDAETTNKIHDYLFVLQQEIERLKGSVPDFPILDKDKICQAIVTRAVDSSRMLLTLDYRTGKPSISLIPNSSWIISSENIVDIIADPSGLKRDLLPDVVKAAVTRLSK